MFTMCLHTVSLRANFEFLHFQQGQKILPVSCVIGVEPTCTWMFLTFSEMHLSLYRWNLYANTSNPVTRKYYRLRSFFLRFCFLDIFFPRYVIYIFYLVCVFLALTNDIMKSFEFGRWRLLYDFTRKYFTRFLHMICNIFTTDLVRLKRTEYTFLSK